jgi:hypothetical protein
VGMLDLLKKELETYEKNKERLIKESLNKFVLIKAGEIIGIYESQSDALDEGYKEFGIEPFLVKGIVEIDRPQNLVSGLVKV